MAGYIEVHTGAVNKPRRVTLNIFNALTITEGGSGEALVTAQNDPAWEVLTLHETYDEVKLMINACGYGVVTLADATGSRWVE